MWTVNSGQWTMGTNGIMDHPVFGKYGTRMGKATVMMPAFFWSYTLQRRWTPNVDAGVSFFDADVQLCKKDIFEKKSSLIC
jgi:hypothetical protein